MDVVSHFFGPLGGKPARVLTLVLVLQALLIYAGSRREAVPAMKPLGSFPAVFGQWHVISEGVIDSELQKVLRADEVLNRVYGRGNFSANLFVAYFKTQRAGQAPHSPKNCLPGSGWAPTAAGVIAITVPGESFPIEVNRYVVSKGPEKSIVFYWYQTRNRVIASEYWAKFYLVLDSIRYNRSDTALVRVVVPVVDNNEAAATSVGIDFVQCFFDRLRDYLPS